IDGAVRRRGVGASPWGEKVLRDGAGTPSANALSLLSVDATLVVGIAGIVASSVTGLGGVWLGAHLSKQTARDLAQDEGEGEEERALKQRKGEAAQKTDERVLEGAAGSPTAVGPALETGRAMADARVRILNAFSRSLVLDDQEITERVRALDLA